MKRSTRLRWRRSVRNTRRHVFNAQTQAAEHLDKHVARRWQKFADVRRFVFGWLFLIAILLAGLFVQNQSLARFYQQEVPAQGGTYSEGVVGEMRNLNPMFASSAPDRTIATLLFDPLLRYDNAMKLTGALAKSWKLNKTQTVYTLTLREDIYWHDGRPITANDVAFTFNTIQHPDTGSPFERSWVGVDVEALDEKTVNFTLPNPFTPFLHSLTRIGIVPAHVLDQVPLSELRAHAFNLAPRVGSGPFTFANINIEDAVGQVRLTKFDQYYAGAPILNEFIIQSFVDHEQMVAGLNDGIVNGVSNVRLEDLQLIEDLDRVNIHAPQLFRNTLLFFNNAKGELKNQKLRQALLQATDTKQVLEELDYRYGVSDSALLKNQFGYSAEYTQYDFNPKAARKLFTEAGWKLADDGILYKSDKPLEIQLVTQSSDEYPMVVESIQKQWRQYGVLVNATLVSPEQLQQEHVLPHAYDVILLGIDQGVDPDVFPYWHSSEARVGGLNLSEFKNLLADAALEAGRTRSNNTLRRAKYQAFLKQWRNDTPAIALYRPTFNYVQLKAVNSDVVDQVVDPTDRLTGVQNWSILTEMVNITM